MRRKFIIALFISISIALIFFLQPKISSLLFSQKRERLLQDFIAYIQKDKNVSMKTYWEFREFYSPGTFIYEPTGLRLKKSETIPSYDIFLDPFQEFTPILFFKSPHFTSIGGITEQKSLSSAETFSMEEIYMNSSNAIFYKTKDNRTILFMIKPLDEVVMANGFILQNEDILNSKKMWFEIAIIH